MQDKQHQSNTHAGVTGIQASPGLGLGRISNKVTYGHYRKMCYLCYLCYQSNFLVTVLVTLLKSVTFSEMALQAVLFWQSNTSNTSNTFEKCYFVGGGIC